MSQNQPDSNRQQPEDLKPKSIDESVDLNEQSNLHQDPPPTWVEWAARGASLIAVLSFLGYIVWSAFQPEVPTSFDVQVKTDQMRHDNGRYVLPISITNRGSAAIEKLTFAIWLKKTDGSEVDYSSLEISLLGAGERTGLEVWFNHDPRDGTVMHTTKNCVL